MTNTKTMTKTETKTMTNPNTMTKTTKNAAHNDHVIKFYMDREADFERWGAFWNSQEGGSGDGLLNAAMLAGIAADKECEMQRRCDNTHRFQRVSAEHWKEMSCTYGISSVFGNTQSSEQQERPIDIVLFAPDNCYLEPTHVHFFMTIEEARECWHDIKHMVPTTVETVGFNEE